MLAKLLGLNYQRIQFTSDILPGDIIGVSIFNAKNHEFKLAWLIQHKLMEGMSE
jgi:MoxR-like ATPase